MLFFLFLSFPIHLSLSVLSQYTHIHPYTLPNPPTSLSFSEGIPEIRVRFFLLLKYRKFSFYCASAPLSTQVFQFPLLVLSLLSLRMANWRKQQAQSHHQVGHWRSSSYNRKPPLDNWHSTVPSWEKKFCASVGLVPWRKLIESKKYMYLHDNVVNWDDSAVKEAFDNAKSRFWAEINGLPCNISLPDPNIYIDDVDWNSSVDPELVLDLEREAKVPSEGEKDEEVVILGSSLLMNQQPFLCTGWGDDEAEVPKPSDPNPAVQGWDSNPPENNGVEDSWGQHCAAVDHAKEYEWQHYQNDSWGWNQREHYGGDSHKMGRGRNGGNGNWGAWNGYNRKRENMTWSKSHACNGNGYQMNRGRRNNRGGRRGNFAYDRPYVDKVPSPAAW